jgi:hypothetical protein
MTVLRSTPHPPAKSLICRPFATAHPCRPSKPVLCYWNNLAANPGHLLWVAASGVAACSQGRKPPSAGVSTRALCGTIRGCASSAAPHIVRRGVRVSLQWRKTLRSLEAIASRTGNRKTQG